MKETREPISRSEAGNPNYFRFKRRPVHLPKRHLCHSTNRKRKNPHLCTSNYPEPEKPYQALLQSNSPVMLLPSKTPFIKEQALLVNQQHSKCLIDIIVTTPGRLVDHIQKTKGI